MTIIDNPVTQRIAMFIGATALTGALSFIIYKEIEHSNNQTLIQKQVVEHKQLLDNIIRSQSEYTSKSDMEKFAKDSGINLKIVKEDLDKLNASIVAINTLVVKSTAQSSTNIPSTSIGVKNPVPIIPLTVECKDGEKFTCPKEDKYGYLSSEQKLSLSEYFGDVKFPLGDVGFSSWKSSPWSVELPSREYHITSILSEDSEKRVFIHSQFTITSGEITTTIPIETSKVMQEPPIAKLSWWNPRAFITAGPIFDLKDFPRAAVSTGITAAVISYGRYTVQPELSFMQLGISYLSNPSSLAFTINPIAYNIGGLFPSTLVRSTFVGPSLSIGLHGEMFAGISFSIGL